MAWSDGIDSTEEAFKIAFSKEPRIRVVAGPGTGKSFAMKRRVARLLEEGVNPSTILPVTFTRVAAEDLHRELVSMNVAGCGELKGRTLHSLAMLTLQKRSVLKSIGRVPRPLNKFEIEPLISDLQREHGGKRKVGKLIKAYESAWARLQNHQPTSTNNPEEVRFERSLTSWLKFHEAMLIGEVIPELYKYLYANPAASERKEYLHIIVDEYQDLNRAEQQVIELLSDNASVCIVGDDNQSIYGFKHAHPEGIRDWQKGNRKDFRLQTCHRCPSQIVAMANSLIEENTLSQDYQPLNPNVDNGKGEVSIKQYNSLEREVAGVSSLVVKMIEDGIPPEDILVLAQRKLFAKPLYDALTEKKVPTKSYHAEHELSEANAQYSFALLKLLANHEDKVALRWLIGYKKKSPNESNSHNWKSAGYLRVRKYCEKMGISPWKAMEGLENGSIQQLPYTQDIITSFRRILRELEELKQLNNQRAIIDKIFPDGDNSTQDLHDLSIGILENEEDGDWTNFIGKLSDKIIQPEIPTKIKDVRIMSLHKSKGLSSPITIIMGCVQGLLPMLMQNVSTEERKKHLEEQRRLFYVGITRTKASPKGQKTGTLILTHSMMMDAKDAYKERINVASKSYGKANLIGSQFINELGAEAPTPEAG